MNRNESLLLEINQTQLLLHEKQKLLEEYDRTLKFQKDESKDCIPTKVDTKLNELNERKRFNSENRIEMYAMMNEKLKEFKGIVLQGITDENNEREKLNQLLLYLSQFLNQDKLRYELDNKLKDIKQLISNQHKRIYVQTNQLQNINTSKNIDIIDNEYDKIINNNTLHLNSEDTIDIGHPSNFSIDNIQSIHLNTTRELVDLFSNSLNNSVNGFNHNNNRSFLNEDLKLNLDDEDEYQMIKVINLFSYK